MFLRSTNRRKDGKNHRYFSIVASRRLPGGKTVQRTVLYLGGINDQQQAAWRKTLDVFPLAYEVMNGNTADSTTLRGFLAKIETTYGKVRRVRVMDRGIPSEAVLEEMREPERQTFYLVGTPKGRIGQHEKK